MTDERESRDDQALSLRTIGSAAVVILLPSFAIFAVPFGAGTASRPSRPPALENIFLPAERIPWAREAPDQPQRLGPLWGNRAEGPAGTLLKVPAGFQAPIHAHTADYRGGVVTGTWSHWVPETGEAARELRPGSYWTQRANEMHGDACVSDSECVILLINEDPYRTYLPD